MKLMGGASPNGRQIDRFASDLRWRYEYDQLRGIPTERLRTLRRAARAEIQQFEGTFPPRASVVRAGCELFVYDAPGEEKEPLTPTERQRLAQLEKDVVANVERAIAMHERRRNDWRGALQRATERAASALDAARGWLERQAEPAQ